MSINRRKDKEDVVHYTMECYPAIKRNQIVPFAEMWIDLRLCDRLSQRAKLSQKEENKYHTLTHTCGIQNDGKDDLICKPEIETQVQRTNKWISRGRDREVG